MPLYEYKCTDCNHRFEITHSMNDEPLKECPVCKKQTLKKLIGGICKMVLKGAGFYCNDYGKKYTVLKGKNGQRK